MEWTLLIGRFYGIDSIVEFLTILVSFFISFYSFRVYKLIKDKHYKLFSIAFLLLGISFFFKILSNITFLHKIEIHEANFVFTVMSHLELMEVVNFFGFIFYKSLHLIGFLLLFLIFTKNDEKNKTLLYIYLSIIVVLFSIYFNFIFHITVVFILIYLTLHFFENYKRVENVNAFLVFISFLIILASHLFFIFSDVNGLFYLFGEVLLLFGFLSLLANQIKLKKESKKVIKKNKIKPGNFIL